MASVTLIFVQTIKVVHGTLIHLQRWPCGLMTWILKPFILKEINEGNKFSRHKQNMSIDGSLGRYSK
jgi:hypothetical protein